MNKFSKFNIIYIFTVAVLSIYIFILVVLQNPKKVQETELDLNKNDEKVFTYIYDNQIWKKGSGTGSYKEYTEEYRKILQDYFNDLDLKVIVDYGCGDF